VILESGAGGRAVWSRDLEEPEGRRTMVLPGVAAFTRVCAYDRPGTLTERNPLIIATESGHNIHQDQPELVIDAIQQVVAAVRDPSRPERVGRPGGVARWVARVTLIASAWRQTSIATDSAVSSLGHGRMLAPPGRCGRLCG
jgi:hypothetical protein